MICYPCEMAYRMERGRGAQQSGGERAERVRAGFGFGVWGVVLRIKYPQEIVVGRGSHL
jgi:hypothetical protein